MNIALTGILAHNPVTLDQQVQGPVQNTQAFTTPQAPVANNVNLAGMEPTTYAATLAAPVVNLNEQTIVNKLKNEFRTVAMNNDDSAETLTALQRSNSVQNLSELATQTKGHLQEKLKRALVETLTNIVTNGHNEVALTDLALNHLVNLVNSDHDTARFATQNLVGLALGRRHVGISGVTTDKELQLTAALQDKAKTALEQRLIATKPSLVLETLLEDKWAGVNTQVLAKTLASGLGNADERVAVLNIISKGIPKSHGYWSHEVNLQDLKAFQLIAQAIRTSGVNDAQSNLVLTELDRTITSIQGKIPVAQTAVVSAPAMQQQFAQVA